MATFARENAKVQAVWYRLAGRAGNPDKYIRQPFNLIRFDDNSGEYIEPVSTVQVVEGYTWSDADYQKYEEQLILDTPVTFSGVTEIR